MIGKLVTEFVQGSNRVSRLKSLQHLLGQAQGLLQQRLKSGGGRVGKIKFEEEACNKIARSRGILRLATDGVEETDSFWG